jgi:hypothetical protein
MDLDAVFLINRVIQEEALYVYMHNILEKHSPVYTRISIAPVRFRGESQVSDKMILFIKSTRQLRV